MRIVNAYSFDFDPLVHAQQFVGESMTIPDQSLSIRDLINRYTMGRPIPTAEGVYTGDDDDLPDLDRMTIQQRMDYSRDLDAFVNTTTMELKRSAAAKQSAKDIVNNATPAPKPDSNDAV